MNRDEVYFGQFMNYPADTLGGATDEDIKGFATTQ